MKIFVSWSGQLSQQIAQLLKTWIPCIIQSADVFFSPDDIEKGENWDGKISTELSSCNYGIVCLTSENTSAPWVHFEAGAIAKTLSSHVTALMINIKTSDIKGPLSRYQATRFEKDDFFQLIESINKESDPPLSPQILKNAFEAIWKPLYDGASAIISSYHPEPDKSKSKTLEQLSSAPLEEILQLLRKQNSILSSPSDILPIDYFRYLQENVFNLKVNGGQSEIYYDLINYLKYVSEQISRCSKEIDITTLNILEYEEIFNILKHSVRSKRLMDELREARAKYQDIILYIEREKVNKLKDEETTA